jgi:hypothetical protein
MTFISPLRKCHLITANTCYCNFFNPNPTLPNKFHNLLPNPAGCSYALPSLTPSTILYTPKKVAAR